MSLSSKNLWVPIFTFQKPTITFPLLILYEIPQLFVCHSACFLPHNAHWKLLFLTTITKARLHWKWHGSIFKQQPLALALGPHACQGRRWGSHRMGARFFQDWLYSLPRQRNLYLSPLFCISLSMVFIDFMEFFFQDGCLAPVAQYWRVQVHPLNPF